MAWQVYLPAISPWIDVRPYTGVNLNSSGTIVSFKSSISFIRSLFFFGIGNSAIYTTNNSYSWTYNYLYASAPNPYQPTNSSLTCFGWCSFGTAPSSTGSAFLTEYGLRRDTSSSTRFGSTGYHLRTNTGASNNCILLPSRPLEKDPEATEQCNATVSTSLSGISYRTSYAHRRSWKFSLLIDGPIDSNRTDFFEDARKYTLQNFFKQAENGVTVHLQGRRTDIRGTTYRTTAPYIGCLDSISGQLTGSSWTLAGQDDKASRYKLELTLDEDPSIYSYVS